MIIEKNLDLSRQEIYRFYRLCLFVRSPLRIGTFCGYFNSVFSDLYFYILVALAIENIPGISHVTAFGYIVRYIVVSKCNNKLSTVLKLKGSDENNRYFCIFSIINTFNMNNVNNVMQTKQSLYSDKQFVKQVFAFLCAQ